MNTTIEQPLHIVVMGVSGTGKTSVARQLAERLGVGFVEGDDLHPEANRTKMAAGHPLTDEDRWPWLARIVARMQESAATGRGLVITCSALKRAYRDILADNGAVTVFAHLQGPHDVVARRLAERSGHFFPTSLLDSQFQTLQPLQEDEPGFTVDIRETVEQEVQDILDALPDFLLRLAERRA